MAAASAAGGGAYIGATPMAIATQIPPSALNGIGSPVVPSAQGKRSLVNGQNEKRSRPPCRNLLRKTLTASVVYKLDFFFLFHFTSLAALFFVYFMKMLINLLYNPVPHLQLIQ